MYLIPYYLNWMIFPNNKGFVTAISHASFGVNTILWNYALYYIVNPNNVLPKIRDPND